jgi:cytidylate kinase
MKNRKELGIPGQNGTKGNSNVCVNGRLMAWIVWASCIFVMAIMAYTIYTKIVSCLERIGVEHTAAIQKVAENE